MSKKIEVNGKLENFNAWAKPLEPITISQRLKKTVIMAESEAIIEMSLRGNEVKKFHDFLFNKKGTDIKIKVILSIVLLLELTILTHC